MTSIISAHIPSIGQNQSPTYPNSITKAGKCNLRLCPRRGARIGQHAASLLHLPISTTDKENGILVLESRFSSKISIKKYIATISVQKQHQWSHPSATKGSQPLLSLGFFKEIKSSLGFKPVDSHLLLFAQDESGNHVTILIDAEKTFHKNLTFLANQDQKETFLIS